MAEHSIPPPVATDLRTLTTALDTATQDQRLAWLGSLPGRQLATLFDLATGQTLTVADMHGPDGQVVIHQGMNSMAMFRSFQKRMVLHDGQIKGHNHQPWAWLIGAGTFIVEPSPEVEGEVYFDYTRLPTTGFPAFPPPKDNTAGLSRFAYGNMIDVVRRVSQHVTIGKAYRHGQYAGYHFVLCRRDD